VAEPLISTSWSGDGEVFSMEFTSEQLRRARIALTIVFIGNGMFSGAMTARLVDIKDGLHLSNGALGVALVFSSVTSFIWMAPVSRLVGRWGSARTTMVGLYTYVITFPLFGILLSPQFLWLTFVLFAIALTTLEVAMNSHAVALEHAYKRRIMTVLHGTWSLGGLVSVGISGILAQSHVPIFVNFLGFSVLNLVAILLVRTWLLPNEVDRQPSVHKVARTGRRRFTLSHVPLFFIILGLLGLSEQIGEGAAGNWGGVLARESYHAGPFVSTLPFLVFSVVMVIGRFFGDGLATRFSTRTILSASGAFIAVGLGVGMLINTLASEIVAWVFLGIGASNVIPLLFSAAGRAARTRGNGVISPSTALALVTAIAYSGYLVGPPSIGYVSDVTSLHVALLIPAALGAVLCVGTLVVMKHTDDVADVAVDGAATALATD